MINLISMNTFEQILTQYVHIRSFLESISKIIADKEYYKTDLNWFKLN